MTKSYACVLLLVLSVCQTSLGQTITVREALSQQAKWDDWVRSEKRLHLSGRYEGRLSRQFRLVKWPAIITPARTTVLPANVESGQRITVSGFLRKSGSRYTMDVDRIAVGSTDSEKMRSRLTKARQPADIYALADEFEVIAKFYEDEDLFAEIDAARKRAFQQQRMLAIDNPTALLSLATQGESLNVPKDTLQAIRFQALVAQSKLPNTPASKILSQIKTVLPGWDKPNAFLDVQEEAAFLKNPVAEYEKANAAARERMHRRWYRLAKLPEIVRQLKPDGSNGLTVAADLSKQLPEETAEVARLKTLYVDYRLKDVPDLTRKQLVDLDVLLREFDRGKETQRAVNTWLVAQERRLDNGQLDGLIATAEEYLFAFERWKKPEHKTKGVDLLKRAWVVASKAAPKDAEMLARRLDQYGWTWLHDRWMTTRQIASLPASDVQLAMREGRVVAGMNAEQVVGTLGEPSRKIRIISAGSIQEIWVFGDAGSTTIVIHMKRGRFESPTDAVATLVAKGSR